MKRQIVILSIITVLMFFLANCEKDENGIPVKYYENVTGEGYVFKINNDGTITPDTPYTTIDHPYKYTPLVTIRAEEKWNENDPYIYDTNNYYHVDFIEVDNNGKYTCRFLEKKRPSFKICNSEEVSISI